ncbi:MAG: photosynthetic complex assembly protein PuhC [Sphingomonadaceae bacterium]
MSATHSHENTVPKGALVLAAMLVSISLLLTSAVRVGALDPVPTAAAQRSAAGTGLVERRSLRFLDRADGAVLIEDAATGERVAIVGEEGGGFIRGVMRGLARERRMYGAGARPPFELALWEDGALSLTDSVTGRVIELGGFGADNRAAFARLLEEPS